MFCTLNYLDYYFIIYAAISLGFDAHQNGYSITYLELLINFSIIKNTAP